MDDDIQFKPPFRQVTTDEIGGRSGQKGAHVEERERLAHHLRWERVKKWNKENNPKKK